MVYFKAAWVYTPLLCAVLGGCASGEFGEARESVRQGKYYIAIEHYMAFAKGQPHHRRAPEALFEVGHLQHSVLGEPDKAIKTFQKIVSTYPVNEHTLLAQKKIAEIYKNHFSNYRQAIEEYEKFLHAAPSHGEIPAILQELAYCYTMVHEFNKATEVYEEIVSRYPKYSRMDEVYFQRGNNFFISGDYEKAIRAYQKLATQYRDSDLAPQAIFGIANAYEEMDEFQKAKEHYLKVVDTYPSPSVVQIRLKGVEDRENSKNNSTPKVRGRRTRSDFELWRG